MQWKNGENFAEKREFSLLKNEKSPDFSRDQFSKIGQFQKICLQHVVFIKVVRVLRELCIMLIQCRANFIGIRTTVCSFEQFRER